MKKILWNDEAGFVVSIELILIATVAVIGLLAGLTSVRDSVVSELSDVAGAVQDVNQGYTVFGVRGHSASTAGMDYIDRSDFCDSADDTNNNPDNCIVIQNQNQIEEGQFPSGPTGS